MKNGEITEQLQFFTHSRGGAFGNAYMKGIKSEISRLAQKEGVKFAGGKSLIEYSVNLAPHQSNTLAYDNDGTTNVNISHVGDLLSGSFAKGNVVNVESVTGNDAFVIGQHKNASFIKELNMILDVLTNIGPDASSLLDKIKGTYKQYDESRSNDGKSKVYKGTK